MLNTLLILNAYFESAEDNKKTLDNLSRIAKLSKWLANLLIGMNKLSHNEAEHYYRQLSELICKELRK